jgi:transcription factor MYB, plant
MMRRMKKEIEDEMLDDDRIGSEFNDEEYDRSARGVLLKKGPWTSAEDDILVNYVKKNGEGNWNAVQKQTGLLRCGKSCRLRWANHLRPNLKKGTFTAEEEQLICELHAKLGNKWARMAAHVSILCIVSLCLTYLVVVFIFSSGFTAIFEFHSFSISMPSLCLPCILQ